MVISVTEFLKRRNSMLVTLVLVIALGYANAGSPYIAESIPSISFSSQYENFNGTVCRLHIMDSDGNDHIKVKPDSDKTTTYFNFEPDGGTNDVWVNITTKRELDREHLGSTIKIKLIITDDQHNEIKYEHTVYILDINDNAPQFHNVPYTLKIDELPCNKTIVYNQISANDLDNGQNGTVTFSIVPIAQTTELEEMYKRKFSIDESTGAISLTECLDYETNSYYQFNVIAKDGGPNGGKSSSAELIIRVQDVQDMPPFFTGLPYMMTTDENIEMSTSLIKIAAKDGDTGVSNSVSYSITDSNCGNVFKINNNTGVISTNIILDRDSGMIQNKSGICVLTVEAKESDNSKKKQLGNTTTTTRVTITVNDVDDNNPKFHKTYYNATIVENAPTNVRLTMNQTLLVSDNDQDQENNKMKIEIRNEDDTPCTDFTASPNVIQGSGNVQILVSNSSFLDYEQIQNTTIKVIATEDINSSKIAVAIVNIEIIDVNDMTPHFNTTSFQLYVKENSENGTKISQITATDEDCSPEFRKLNYSINGGNGRFIVDTDTGDIFVNCTDCVAQLDREKQNIYYMTYTAKDVDRRSDSVSLIIEVTDENDNAPKFLSSIYKAVADENDAKYLNETSPLIKIEAIDADKENTNNSLVTYFITSTSPSNLDSNFTINNNTGNIKLQTVLDYEQLLGTQGEINITVEARDNGKPTLNSTTIVNLHVQDKNDNTPRFNSTYYDATVSEDAVSTENNYTNVAQVFASDNDGTKRNKLLNYIIIKGGSDRFTIDAGTGMVKVQLGVTLDRETTSNYTLTILAIDQGYPPRTGSTNMLIMVTDVNDSPPRFNQSEYAVSVKEDANISKAALTCPATDLDLNHTLQYNITNIEAFDETGGNVNISAVSDYFGIHQNNGTIFVKGKLDRETAARIILMLQVTDVNAQKNLPQTAKATLTITLEDVNDNFPEFTNKSYQFSIIENARRGAILGTVKATDKDINRTITYSLTGRSTDKFKIDSKTGILSKLGVLDRENTTVEYVNVTATDSGIPPKSKDVYVSIVVDDFNDNAPKFGGFNRTVYLNESSENGTENGTIVLTINASDADEGPNRNITFFIDPSIDAFEINKSTGVITVRNTVDRESTPAYNLHIWAKDNPVDKKEQKSSDTTVKVIVDDINDNCPNFTMVKYNATVEENKPNGTIITTVSANDKDIGENAKISYKIKNSSNTTLFTIDENSGIVKVKHDLNDKIGYYNYTVIAYDHGNPKLNGTAKLSIHVIDLNNHQPVITNIPDGHEISVYECASVGAKVYDFNYTDGDFSDINKHAAFKIVSQSNESNAFNLTQDGKLFVHDELDFFKKEIYTLEIQATDTGKVPLSSDPVFITVHILDVNDHVPSFTNNITTLTLSENSTFKDSVKQVTAIDDDRNSKLCYEMTKSNWTEYFNISKTDGKIFNIKKLDYERAHSMELEIKVNDCSLPDNTTHCGLNQTKIIKKNKDEEQTTIKVLITVTDTDDNPPVFKQKHLATGMRRNTEADTELELHLRNTSYINDADSPENGVLGWTFSNCRNITVSPELQNKIKHDSGDKLCDDGIKHIFCITKNGTIVNNKFFSEDLSGYFIVTVNVSDKAGFDTANVTIYLISDSQVITMSILKPKDWVAYRKDDLLSELSKILGYTAVFDSIQDHRENGVLNTQGSDLKFHIVDPKTQAVLAGKDSIELFDKQANNAEMINLQNTYSVMKVTQHNMDESTAEEGSKKLTLILVAVSIGEALIIAIVIFVALSARNKFRRKLKAAVINTPDMEMHVLEQKEAAIPGSNLYSKQNNPLLNADIKDVIHDQGVDDESSRSFEDVDLDENVVDDHTTVYDRIEEKEATMDMYNDDTYHSISSEDLLDATLNLHAMRKSKESLDKIDDDSHDVTYHSEDTTAAFINESFMEDLESTEI